MSHEIWQTVRDARTWLDAADGTPDLTCRILKITEEAGEAAAAWIGALGANPRKGVTHTRAEVAAELADVVMAALVAIESLDMDAQQVLSECAAKVARRLPTHP